MTVIIEIGHILKAGLDPVPWTLDSGLWTLDSGLWTLVFFSQNFISPPRKKPLYLPPPRKNLYIQPMKLPLPQ